MESESLFFAKRTDWNCAVNTIISCWKENRQHCLSPIDLSESNPTRCHFHFTKDCDLEALTADQARSYAPCAQGIEAARSAVVDYYQQRNLNVDPARLYLTSSTSEAYSFLFRLLCDPHDTILLPSPSYPLFDFICDINDVELIRYQLNQQTQWGFDLSQSVTSQIEKLKAVVLVNPNNPTGSYVQRSELNQINSFCKQNHCAIISDEVFWDYALIDDLKPLSLVGNDEVLSFSLGGLSKSLALPQMKLSWIIINGPDEQVTQAKQRLDIIADTFLSVNAPVQHALSVWIKDSHIVQAEIKKRLKENFLFLNNAFRHIAKVNVFEPQGGWYAVCDLGVVDEEDLVCALIKEKNILIHPGYFYDFQRDGYCVISLLLPQDSFQQGISRMCSYLEL